MSNRTFYASTYVVADGVTRTWPFSFAGVNTGQESGTTPYLYPEDVKVQEIFTDSDGNKQTVQRTGILAAPNHLTIDGPAVLAGREIRIYRETELRFPLVDYRDLQSVSEHDLDLANRQAVFLAQETRDTASANLVYDKQGHYNAGGRRIVNLAPGIAPRDAVTVDQLQHAIRIPITEPVLAELPSAVNRAMKILAFDNAGLPTVAFPATSSALELEMRLAEAYGASMIGGTAPTVNSWDDLIVTKGRRPGDRLSLIALTNDWAMRPTAPYPFGHGEFVWDATSTAPAIYGMVASVAGVPTGRWLRKFSGAVHVTWFGAIPDGVTKCSAAFQLAADKYLAVYIPPGTFLLENAQVHPLIYSTSLVTCGLKLTKEQKCRELYGAGAASKVICQVGERYIAVIGHWNVDGVNIHSFSMDGGYDRSGDKFKAALSGIRQQAIRRSRVYNMTITNFTYHCISVYGGSNAVTEPACTGNTWSNLYLDGGGQSTLLVYSATWNGLVLPNTDNTFSDIYALNSHVYFGIEVRKSNRNLFVNIVAHGNQKGGINLEEGASYNRFTNLSSKYNGYGLHMVDNNVEAIVGNVFDQFDLSDNRIHGVMAISGAVANQFLNGSMSRSGSGNGWRSENATSVNNILRNVEASNNGTDGLTFQAAQDLDGVVCNNNARWGVTAYGPARLRNVKASGNQLDIQGTVDSVIDAEQCSFGANHAMAFRNGSDPGKVVQTHQCGRYSAGGADVSMVEVAGSFSPKVWRTTVKYGTFARIQLGHFAGMGADIRIRFRVQTDGAAIRILRNIEGAGISVNVPAATGWQWVVMTIPAASITPTYAAKMRYEHEEGFMLFDAYTISIT